MSHEALRHNCELCLASRPPRHCAYSLNLSPARRLASPFFALHSPSMPFGINNPLPSNMRSECKKCGKILASFVDPRQAFGPDKIIPPEILANAKVRLMRFEEVAVIDRTFHRVSLSSLSSKLAFSVPAALVPV